MLSQGPAETRPSAWQGCTPLPPPRPRGAAATAVPWGAVGLLLQREPGDAMWHPGTRGDLGWSRAPVSHEHSGAWCRGTPSLVPATFLPFPSVGPALPSPQPLSAGSHRAQRSLQALPNRQSTALPDPLPRQSQHFSLPGVSAPRAGETRSLAAISVALPCHLV